MRRLYPEMKVCLIVFVLLVSGVYSWGEEGHAIVGWLGGRMLTERAQANVNKLLENINSFDAVEQFPFKKEYDQFFEVKELSDISLFADLYKRKSTEITVKQFPTVDPTKLSFSASSHSKVYSLYNATYSIHFESESNSCGEELLNICSQSNIPSEFPCVLNCISESIEYYKKKLGEAKDKYIASLSLIFLVHLIGDIHQPFHCGFADDAGGNKAWAYLPSQDACYRIHYLWDTKLLQNTLKSEPWRHLATILEEKAKLFYDTHKQSPKSPSFWWNESHSFLAEQGLDSQGKHTSFPYSKLNSSFVCSESPYRKKIDYGIVTNEYEEWYSVVMKRQLSRAGARLAMTLNSILGTTSWKLPTEQGRSYLYQLTHPKRIKDEL